MIRTALIVTSLVGAGLEQEARILKNFLESHGVATTLLHYTDMSTYVSPVDAMFSLEVVMPRSLGLAKKNYLFPNSEWWLPHNDQYLPRFDKILCKTQDCFEIWSRKVGMSRCAYTGFESRDLYDPSIVREPNFLHIAGKSEQKGTQAVLDCWYQYSDLPPLTIVCSNPKFRKVIVPEQGSPVKWFDKRTDAEMKILMNIHQYHIAPSEYEGYGHTIHEGLGCDAHVITTMGASTQVPGTSPVGIFPCKLEQRYLATLCKVNGSGVYAAIRLFLDKKWNECTISPRHFFLRDREFFRHTLWDEINQ